MAVREWCRAGHRDPLGDPIEQGYLGGLLRLTLLALDLVEAILSCRHTATLALTPLLLDRHHKHRCIRFERQAVRAWMHHTKSH